MSARGTMTMRATVSRNTSSGSNDWGTRATPVFYEVGVIPCRAWSERKSDDSDSSKSAVVERILAIVPVGADVEERDQLVIVDRRGELQFEGPVAVRTKFRGSGSVSRPSHFTLDLTRHL